MKRLLIAVLALVVVVPLTGAAKPQGKVRVKCPTAKELKAGITACPDTGCGTVDPLLNQIKNIGLSDLSPEDKDFEYLADLPPRVHGYDQLGDPRDALVKRGEGKMIRVVAWALAARKGSKESCNCGLGRPENTDNHIVLVDDHALKLTAKATRARPATATRKAVKARSAKYNILKKREAMSQTAEFTPRVRTHHPNLIGQDLQALIDAQGGKLFVRVTGLQMYDSEHALGRKLVRFNDWEIHPVFDWSIARKMKLAVRPVIQIGKTLGNNFLGAPAPYYG